MRVVLDTNVLLSALISPHGAPETIYRAWQSGAFDVVTSTHQLDEIRRASRYPKLKAILPAHRVGVLVNYLQRAVVLERLPPLPDGIGTEDPDDSFLLATAVAADVDYVVTGDRRAGLLRQGHVGRARIVTPSAFCDLAL
jgi:putative PIN family toxin of toxin-antitoxin system